MTVDISWYRMMSVADIILGSARDKRGVRVVMAAVSAYERALKAVMTQESPHEWAETQWGLGSSLFLLSQRSHNDKHATAAIAAFRSALDIADMAMRPDLLVGLNVAIGRALLDAHERRPGSVDLRGAIKAFRAALAACPESPGTSLWAVMTRDLGTATILLGAQTLEMALISEGARAVRSAMRMMSKGYEPAEWKLAAKALSIALAAVHPSEASCEEG